MPVAGWFRRWRGGRGADERAPAPVLAAARGEPLSQLLALSARALLATAHADRAGLWLSSDRRGEPGSGCVVEAEPGPIPEQWKRLDVSTPFLRAALEGSGALHVESIAGEPASHLGPLIGMHSAVWIPLRERGRTFGLAMVSYFRPPRHLDLDALRARADEITLAVEHDRNARRGKAVAEELRAHLRISRASLSGVAVDSILPQIARAARHYLQAEFVAVGRGNALPISGDGWDGADEWPALQHHESLLQLWRTVLSAGRESEIHGGELIQLPGTPIQAGVASLDRVVAIPLDVRGATRGVLMAGMPRSEDSGEDFSRLESYGLLAAAALDREAAREERAASGAALRTMVEGSTESLILIDGNGSIVGASREAAAILLPRRHGSDKLVLAELFSSVARDAVSEWRERLGSRASGPELEFAGESESQPEKQVAAPVLEAALQCGAVVRLHFRGEISAAGSNGRRWLIQVEDLAARQALHETEERLEAEMAGLLDSIESGVLLLDAEGRILKASDRLAAIFGLQSRRFQELGTIGALIDSLAYHLIRPAETAARWREHVRRGDEASWDEFELVRPSRKIVERFARPLHKPDGTRIGWLEVYRDITGQRMIQSKLLQTEKMAALGQIVSGIAHELNNPLTSIQGYAQLLVSRRSATDRAGDAQRISQEAERAGRIVKNLLLFARETKPERGAVNLNDVIERTLSLRAYELKLQNIDLELALDPALPQTLADAAQFQQVVLNLIVNAEQAIVAGRGEEVRNGRILIRTRRLAGDRLAMEISDDGQGIAPENRGAHF